MRSHNDAPYVVQTVQAIRHQSLDDFELIGVDNDSRDGTAEYVRHVSDRFMRVAAGRYRPGPVLNRAASAARGEILVFINSDATPQGCDWLRELVRPVRDGWTVATFGRQIPRPKATPWVRSDYNRAFGDGAGHSGWRHFFSLANSAMLRSAWARHPFSEQLRYSEDVEWSYWYKQRGVPIAYVSAASATHSHNYTIRQSWRRHYGEGEAEAAIFGYAPEQDNIARRLFARWAAAVVRDVRHLTRQGEWRALSWSLAVRTTERVAEYVGYRRGVRGQNGVHATS
jgi:rhamnosyltransferase